MSNLMLRVLTAVVGVPAILALLIYGGYFGTGIFALIISFGMAVEYSGLFFSLSDRLEKRIAFVGSVFILHALSLWLGLGLPSALIGLAPLFGFFIAFVLGARKHAENESNLIRHVGELKSAVFGFTYVGWGPLLLVSVRGVLNGLSFVLLTLVLVWATDTFAYFGGKYLGKTKLCPQVSPKKTWAGAVAGSLGAMAVGVVAGLVAIPDFYWLTGAFLGLTASVASQLGDLGESLLKRAAQVKDSGSILPGHGGFLDRFDGLVFALPVVSAYLWLFRA